MAQASIAPDTQDTRPNVSGASVPLDRVDIFPAVPLSPYQATGGPAFAARMRGDQSSDLYAIICNSGLPTRIDLATAMRTIDHRSVLKLVENGVVEWIDKNFYPVLIYERPKGPRLMQSFDEPTVVMNEDVLLRRFIQPLISALTELRRPGIFHGGIRPTNIFWQYGSADPPVLGECLSAPCGLLEPVLFSPVTRALATPIGRGPGVHEDDCYALGVTIALMVLGQNTLKGLDDGAIIKAKIEQGSFNALVGHHRISPVHIELLRGLLADDTEQRWSAAELEQWVAGRRLTPKSSDSGRRASRHFDFAKAEYWQVRPLAQAMAEKPEEASLVIETGVLDRWLRRSLADEPRAENVVDAIKLTKDQGGSAHYQDHLTSRTCMALDPQAPIRFRSISALPLGIAPLLAQAVTTGIGIDVLVEMVSTQLVPCWVQMQRHKTSDMVPLIQQFERLGTIVTKTTYGNGVERACYELNTSLPCLSPMLRSQYVMTSKALLPALERVASGADRPREPMDRHIAAFLIVRDRRSEKLLDLMSLPETNPRRGLAMLTLLSEMQVRHGPDKLPKLAQWIAPHVEGASKRFFGKVLREQLKKQMKESADRGDLSALLQIVDNPQRLERDEKDFVAARLIYFSILKEINSLEGKISDREAVVSKVGKPAAAALSGLLAAVAFLFVAARLLWTSL